MRTVTMRVDDKVKKKIDKKLTIKHIYGSNLLDLKPKKYLSKDKNVRMMEWIKRKKF